MFANLNNFFVKKRFLLLTMLLLVYNQPKLNAYCTPCVCTEFASSAMQEVYLQTQMGILDGYIKGELQKAIDAAKKGLKLVKDSYANIINTEETETIVLKNEAEIVGLLEKLYKQKILEVEAKKALIKEKLTTNEIKIIKDF